jgi:hypothetical protein
MSISEHKQVSEADAPARRCELAPKRAPITQLERRIFASVDRTCVPAKFKLSWRYVGGGRVVLLGVSGAQGRLGLAGARRQRDAGGFEQARRRGRSVSAHQPIGVAMADANLGEAAEVAQQIVPFRGQPGLARKIVEMLLRRQRQERAEHVAADGGVGGMEDRSRAHDRLGPHEEVFDLKTVAVAQHGLQRRQLDVGSEHEHAVEARLLGELASAARPRPNASLSSAAPCRR